MRWFVLLGVLGGCDTVFSVDHVGPTRDDARGADAALDAAPGCWSAFQQDHDEDGDGRMDGCDNCPAVFNEQQEDDDGDQVGNACDPHPGMPDRIVYFNGFESTARGFTTRNGAWTISNDTFVQSDVARAYAFLEGEFTGATVEVRLQGVTQPATGADHAGAYVAATAVDLDPPHGLRCYEAKVAGDSDQSVIENVGTTQVTILPIDGPKPFYMRLSVQGANSRPLCRTSRGNGDVDVTFSNLVAQTGSIALETTNSACAFLSVTVMN
ncbi:MAG TPA: hypothetical protein VMZ53_07490 [Kofleriaceae bacterium]|nr:hypothetical protein [Kofleriaceae bacterium]